MRQPNGIDFWRGFALVTIFVEHIPGNFFERFSFRNLTLSESSEIFVFLAGWAMRLSIDSSKQSSTASTLVWKLWSRAFTLYVAQTLITEIAIFILAAASVRLDAPFLLDWYNVGAVFLQPVEAHIGLVLLTHQLGYFNILPLYVVLMLGAPAIAILYRAAPRLLLPTSLALYALTLGFGWNLPSWPTEGTWFFSPSAWQLICVLGFLLAGAKTDVGAFARRHLGTIRWISLPIVVAGFVIALTRYFPNLVDLSHTALFLVVSDKTFLSPDRLISALAIMALMSSSFTYILRWLPRFAAFLSLLGRNGLQVFCAGSLLSLSGQIVRFIYGGSITTDFVLFVVGVAVMALIAWMTEWRSRSKAQATRAPTPAAESAQSAGQNVLVPTGSPVSSSVASS